MTKSERRVNVRMDDKRMADVEYMAAKFIMGASEFVRTMLPARHIFDAVIMAEMIPDPQRLGASADAWLCRLMRLMLLYESPKAVWLHVQFVPAEQLPFMFRTWCNALRADDQREQQRTGQVVGGELQPDGSIIPLLEPAMECYGFQRVAGTGHYILYGPGFYDTQEERDALAERIVRRVRG